MRPDRAAILGLIAVSWISTAAVGDIGVTLQPVGFDLGGPIPIGSVVQVAVLLRTDPADEPLRDVRMVLLDFTGTSDTFEIRRVDWALEPDAYAFQTPPSVSLPEAAIVSLLFESDSRLGTLTTEPRQVALLEVLVRGPGTIRVLGADSPDRPGRARVDAGFLPRRTFSAAAGALRDGVLEIPSVTGGPIDPPPDDGPGTVNDNGGGADPGSDDEPGSGPTASGGCGPAACGGAPGAVWLLVLYGVSLATRRHPRA